MVLLTMASTACAPEAAPPRAGGDPHGRLACAECHNGAFADRDVAAVPSGACVASGCHRDQVPGEITLASVPFTHRGHGSTADLSIGCAGCHTHEVGGQPLEAGAETCGLCHAEEVSGARGEDCRLCHVSLEHQGVTSQGVSIPHEGLPWIEGGCLRCHYAVSRPVHEVSLTRCGACHEDVQAVTRAGIGDDLHPLHTGSSCGSCHEEDNHQIEAMSSAVELQCASCHTAEHGVEVDPAKVAASTCETCHESVHEGPQRLVLGILPEAGAATPSDHFMDGLTCRSCHLPPGTGPAGRRLGTAEACVQCHRPEYAKILGWWSEGIAQRTSMVDRYLAGAEAVVSGRGEDDAAVRAAARARAMLDVIETAGGQHNLPLTHRVFVDAVAGAAEAYRLSGRAAPPRPSLGRSPRQRICSYCHYGLPQPGFTERMDDAFHREVLGAR